MQNPFESGHIKNYLLLYASIVVIMILFFIASTLFHDVQQKEQKVFNTQLPAQEETLATKKEIPTKSKFRLMESAY